MYPTTASYSVRLRPQSGSGNTGSFTRKRHTFPVCQTSAKR
ncbi:hypothetical protein NEIPOLOT_02301 [Neisseria polysaccharea ATCC 43768]|nr:hypothetical protein NEIPOLOT_02301 [Neisseria polysaccharea ATCC 43768]